MDLRIMDYKVHRNNIPNKHLKLVNSFIQRNSAVVRIQRKNLNQILVYLQATTEVRSSLFWATALPRPSYANLLLFTIRG
jgi:hypothetical protein